MENLKEKLPMIIAIIVSLAIWAGIYYLLFCHPTFYYTKIDNTKVTTLPSTEDMKYEYTLTGYTENGRKKEIKFKTSRQLKENAYLKLEVMAIVGVKSWGEVQYNELSEKVQNKYK